MRDIKGYEGLYAITSCGKVWSYRSQKFLSQRLRKDGYYDVKLSNKGQEERLLIHRLIAEAYIPNPIGLPVVNHKDENKSNNRINNLEWATYQYNSEYSLSKKIYCVELDKMFDGITIASNELKISKGDICWACKGKRKTAGGYHWRYAE